MEMAFVDQAVEQGCVKLDRYLENPIAQAIMIRIRMLRATRYQHQVQIADLFHRISDNPHRPFRVLHVIQLKLPMRMQREMEPLDSWLGQSLGWEVRQGVNF